MGNKRAFNRDVVAARAQGKSVQYQLDGLKQQFAEYRAAVRGVIVEARDALIAGDVEKTRAALDELERNTKESKS